MRFSLVTAALAVAGSALAEDLLFLDDLVGHEEDHALALGFTTKVVTETEWRAMKTSDFAAFKAIIIGDPGGSRDVGRIKFLEDTNTIWGPAVTGNIIIHGADQSNHDSPGNGASILIDNSLKFAAAGVSATGLFQTGLYLSLSQYYGPAAVGTPVPALSYFGTFEVFGQDTGGIGGYDDIHIVATSPAIDTLTDEALSNWGFSTHEAFSSYPSVGQNGFQALAIADGVITTGTQNYGDGHSGLPYILSRGATPAGCGDGKFDPSLGEECDDGNTADGDGCSKSCKCESGVANPDGSCGSVISNSTTSSSQTTSSSTIFSSPTLSTTSTTTAKQYSNATTSTVTWTSSLPHLTTSATRLTTSSKGWVPPPYITPSVPKNSVCFGIEIIESATQVTWTDVIDPTRTITYTTTSVISTFQKPIINTPLPSMPCYVCAFKSQGIPTTNWVTATTTHCPSCDITQPAVIYPCSTCRGTTLTASCPWEVTPTWSVHPYTTYAPATHESVHPTGASNGTTYAYTTATPAPGPARTFTTAVAPATATSAWTPDPTSIVQPYTGAASKPTGMVNIVGVVLGAAAMAALVI